MKKSTQYWLVGCGGGCALIVLGIAALIVGGGIFVKDTMEGFEQAIETRKALEDEHGTVAEFTPWPDGAVPPERMEAFLAVREAAAPAREKLVATFAALPTSPGAAEELDAKPFLEKMRAVFDITRSAVGMGAEMGQFFDARNRALVDQGMGLGEYTYVYAIAFYVYLGHPIDETGTGIPMPNMAARRLPRELLAMVKNQLAALPEAGDATWKARLSEEIAALEQDGDRLPWQDGLPTAIAASLEPYRERLESSYVREANPFELARNRRRGMSIEAE